MDTNAHRLPVALAFSWAAITAGWWAFAFYPAGPDAGAWLALAQQVCFGTLPNGLPDTYGWILLVGMPAGLGSALLVVYWEEYARALAAAPLRRAFTAAALCLLLLGGWVSGRIREGLALDMVSFESQLSGDLPENYPRTQKVLPDFKLLNQHDQSIEAGDLKGVPTVLTFAYANCTTVCPLLVRDAAATARILGPEKSRALLITLDPWRDRPSRLKALAGSWELPANAWFTSGSVEAVNQVLDALNVARQRDPLSGELSHPGLVYVLDRDGRIAYTFQNPPAAWLEQAVQRINQSAS